uniref:Dishevelled binding antagonist of beta catenin 3 n=1 Tax=Equus asinus TaxID=9793 RepID=A0A9L0JCE1_EQUAS
MIRAFSFPVSPERGRLRGWLEGSLAGLCELHWLRERQEYRVQQALRLAQPGMGGAEAEDEEDADEDEDAAAARRAAAALEEQLEALPGLIWDLGQQLGDLSLESGGLEQDSGRSSGFYEDPGSTGAPDSPPSTFCGDSGFSGSGSYGRLGPSEPRGIYASERPKSLGDASPSAPEAVGSRAAVPRSFSAPYPTAAGSVGPEACSSAERRARAGPFLTPSPLHAAVALRSPRPCARPPPDLPDAAAGGAGRPLDGYISALLRRRRRRGAGQPRTSPGGGRTGSAAPEQRAPAAARRVPAPRRRAGPRPSPRWSARWGPCRQPGRLGPRVGLAVGVGGGARAGRAARRALAPRPPRRGPPGEGAVHPGARRPPPRGLPGRAARRKAPPLTRGRSVEQSPPRERPRAAGRRGRMTEASGRRGSPRARKAARSQSETSLLGRAAAVPPGPPKYPTAEREEPRPPRPRRGPAPTLAAQAAGACARWRSTARDRRSRGAPRPSRAPAARGPCPARPRRLRSAACSTAARAATRSARPGAWGPSDAGGLQGEASAGATGRASRAPARASRPPSAPPLATQTAAVASCGRSSWWQPPRPPGRGRVQVEARPRAPLKSS